MSLLRFGAATAFLVAIVAAPSPARAEDRWLGPDKASHFAVSGVLAIGGYAIGSAIFPDGQAAPLLIGAGLSITAGIAKEVVDLAGYGTPSWKDLAWDGIGTVTGLAIAWSVTTLIRAVLPPKEKPPMSASRYLVSF